MTSDMSPSSFDFCICLECIIAITEKDDAKTSEFAKIRVKSIVPWAYDMSTASDIAHGTARIIFMRVLPSIVFPHGFFDIARLASRRI